MTLSAVEICNLALANIPARPIVSMDDNTVTANACRREFTQAVQELMEMGEWGFAVKRAALVSAPNDRTGYYGYAFLAPNDMAFPLSTSADGSSNLCGRSGDFDFEGGVIWACGDSVVLEYVSNTPAFSEMSAMFRRGLAAVLASRIVMDVTRDAGRKRELLQEAEIFRDRALARSLNANAQQNTYGDNFIPSSLRGHMDMGLKGHAPRPPISTAPVIAPAPPVPFDFGGFYDNLPDS